MEELCGTGIVTVQSPRTTTMGKRGIQGQATGAPGDIGLEQEQWTGTVDWDTLLSDPPLRYQIAWNGNW